jgi:hypothetical protein
VSVSPKENYVAKEEELKLCDKLVKKIQPFYGINFGNFKSYDTIFTSNTFNLIKNKNDSSRFLNEPKESRNFTEIPQFQL